jgi:hypothetical protein
MADRSTLRCGAPAPRLLAREAGGHPGVEPGGEGLARA